MKVVAVVCCLVAVLAAPAIAAPTHAKSLAQSLAQVQGATSAEARQEAIAKLRAVLAPLKEDLQARLDTITEVQALDEAPITEQLAKINQTIEATLDSSAQARDRLFDIPTKQSTLEASKTHLTASIASLRSQLQRTTEQGQAKLAEIQAQLTRSRNDANVLTELLKWMDANANHPELVFAHVQQAMSAVQTSADELSNALVQLSSDTQTKTHEETVASLRAHIVELRQQVHEDVHTHEEHLGSETLKLAQETERLNADITSGERSLQDVSSQLHSLQNQLKFHQETLVNNEVSLTQAKTTQSHLLHDREQSRALFEFEKTKLHEMLASITDIEAKINA